MEFPLTLFADANFQGSHKHVFLYTQDNPADTPWMNLWDFDNATSSIYITEGKWVFYKEFNLVNPCVDADGHEIVLGPYRYYWVETDNCLLPGSNDSISSVKRVE